jgi:hypothetical protein
MPIYQAFNSRIDSWVKYEFIKGQGFKALDVKQVEPLKPFHGIQIKGNRR